MHCTRVLTLLVLGAGLVQSFKWDIVVGGDKQLQFYYNDTLTHIEVIPSARWITAVTYDPVHYRMLLVDSDSSNTSISSFDLSTRTIQRLFSTEGYYWMIVYDPVTEALYWEGYTSIYAFSLNPASSNQVDKNLIINLEYFCRDPVVDSCGGYIYWITPDYEIWRARLNDTEREILITNVFMRNSLAIDQQTQKIYWTEQTHINDELWSIGSANFNGKNKTTLHIMRNTAYPILLTVSKDFIYWQDFREPGIWQIPKYSSQTVARKLHSMPSTDCVNCHLIATNYAINDQIQGIKTCDSLQVLIPNDSQSESTVSVCQNYCFKGECGVSAEGQPTCSCEAGYSGERCEVNACHKHCLNGGVCSLNEEGKPACQCTAGYDGERCDVSICKDYCFQGNCSVGTVGQPKCSCLISYSGERCEENACHKHCLNGGVCSLNEEDEPSCQCSAGYDGGRCEVSSNKDDCSDFSNEGKISACHQFCLNEGTCSLNEASEPVCQCTTDYEGKRCEVPVNTDFSIQAACGVSAEGQPKVIVTLGQGLHSTCALTIV